MTVFSQQATFLGVGNGDSGLANDGAISTSTQTSAFCILQGEDGLAHVGALSSAGTTPVRFYMKKADGTIKLSPWFTYDSIIPSSKKYGAFSAPVEQVSYLGANSAGTIGGLGTITAGNNYIATVTLKHSQTDTNNTPLVKQFATQAITGDSQQTVAKALFESANRVLNRGLAAPMINVERVATGDTNTGAALATANLFYFVNGSKTVTAYLKDTAADVAMTASTTTVVATSSTTGAGKITIPSSNGTAFTFTAITSVGHAIYLGGKSIYVASAGNSAQNCAAIVAAVNAATTGIGSICVATGTTTVTLTLKKGVQTLPPVVFNDPAGTIGIVAVTTGTGESMSVKYNFEATTSGAATFQLDEPYQGVTGYCTTATIDSAAKLTYLTGTYTIGANPLWGLKLTGLPQAFSAITGKYQKVRFDVMPESNTNTPINLYTGTAYSVMQGFDTAVTYGQAQGASEGIGTYEAVAEQEALIQWATKGNTQLQAYPPTNYVFDTVAGADYSILSFTTKNTLNDTPGVQPYTFMNYTIAIQKNLFDSGEDGHDIAAALVIALS